MRIHLDPASMEDYGLFLRIKSLPRYRFEGRIAVVPDEYAALLGKAAERPESGEYTPIAGLFDYQSGIARLAIRKRKFAVFADCGMGKSNIMFEFVRHAAKAVGPDRRVLIISPPMVVRQTLAEAAKFYGDGLPIERVVARELPAWLESSAGGIGITNYEALKETTPVGMLGALCLDESSSLKGHYGKWAAECIRLGKGLDWKLAMTGTPAPNDRIEYANHAVFLDAFPTVNAFLAKYFVNRGQTDNRWELKPHALGPFYRSLSDWCIFLTNPATYGWKDNTGTIPPIRVHIHDVGLTADQQSAVRDETGTLFVTRMGGITTRSKLARIAKGSGANGKVETLKPAFIRSLIDSWPDESTIVWCRFNDEQDRIAAEVPEAVSLSGSTPDDVRERMIDDFKAGKVRTMISKGKLLGFGLNLQVCTRQIFSSLHDSYEEYYQCVKRSNRVGSTRELNVHVPITEVERPMLENVLRKASMVQRDTEEQESIFRHYSLDGMGVIG